MKVQQLAPNKKPTMQKSQKDNDRKKRLLYVAIFFFTSVLLISPLIFGYNIRDLKSFGLVGIALINFFSSATLFLPAPGFLAVGVGGNIYNPLLVAFMAALGSTLGESVGFLFGYSSKKLTASQQHILDSIEKFFHHKYTGVLIVLMAFIPNPIFDAVGIVAGISLFPFKKFLILVFIGRFLRDIIIAYAGQQLL